MVIGLRCFTLLSVGISETTLVFVSANEKTGKEPRIAWRSSIPAIFQCSLDSRPFVRCGDLNGLRYTGQWIGRNISEGFHILRVTPVYADGSEGTTISHSWIVGKAL